MYDNKLCVAVGTCTKYLFVFHQRKVGYAFMFFGSSIVLYFFQLVKNFGFNEQFANIKIFYAYFVLAGKNKKSMHSASLLLASFIIYT